MNKNGPIIIIEDDMDDVNLMSEIFKELNCKNEILYFQDGIAALEYLQNTTDKPFLVISDINMPKMDGMELRERIHNNEELKIKCLPFLFFTTSADPAMVLKAYTHSIQGYFIKPNNYIFWKATIKEILDYWLSCVSPTYTVRAKS